MIDERAPFECTPFNVRTRRLEKFWWSVRDPDEADRQAAQHPEWSWVYENHAGQADTHFVHPDDAEIAPRTPEARAAGLYIDEADEAQVEVPVSVGRIVTERDRRLSLGFDYDFGDDRGTHHFGTTPDDMKGWDEVTTLAAAMIAAGQEADTITILTDTAPAVVTAAEWQDVLLAAGAFRQPIWQASFAIAAMDPIPQDFTDDSYWS